MTPSSRRNLNICLALVALSLQHTNAWLPATMNHPRHSLVKAWMAITIDDIPVDTFGDVNQGHEEEEEHLAYYNSDAAQTIFPFLDQWRLHQHDGSLVGIVCNHPAYKDGETIATSPLDGDHPAVECIVTTVTGSQYLLGHELVVTIRDWKVTSDGGLQGIVSDSYPHVDLTEGQRITTSPTAMFAEEDTVITTESGSHYHLLEPFVFPLLEQWKRLEGGSIAGYVYHHKKIQDGEIITTTPLVELDESQDGLILVTTASGSQYQLGVAEPEKQFEQEYEAAAAYDMEEEEEVVDDGIYYGEDSDDEEEEEEEEIVSYHIPIPRAPKMSPLEHVFAAAVHHHQKMVDQHRNKMPKTSVPQVEELELVVLSEDTMRLDHRFQNATSWSNQTAWQY